MPAFRRADRKSGKVIIAFAIETRHFRRLPAKQRRAGLFAPLGDAGNHLLSHGRVEFAGGEIIQKKQRFSALNYEIVDAHGDQIDADCVMTARIDSDLEFGSHAVIGGDQDRITEAGVLQIE